MISYDTKVGLDPRLPNNPAPSAQYMQALHWRLTDVLREFAQAINGQDVWEDLSLPGGGHQPDRGAGCGELRHDYLSGDAAVRRATSIITWPAWRRCRTPGARGRRFGHTFTGPSLRRMPAARR